MAESFAGQASIEVQGVRKVYRGGTVALDGVDLEIGTGLFGLLGPNGAGKSTLMRIICTLLAPSSGVVKVCGANVMLERRRVREKIGYLPQEFGAWRLHRVEEVLDTLGIIAGLGNKVERRRRVLEVLDSVGLKDVAGRKVKKLSGGMLRRLGVAQALFHEPEVLVVDEPTVGLDPEERLRFRQLVARLGQERVILLSTHIVGDLGPGCRDLALLDKGKVVFRGSPAELMRHASGKVFEALIPTGQESGFLRPGVEEVSRRPEGNSLRVRAVVADGKAPEGAQPVAEATLEEAYLSFMASRGRVEAALAEAES